MENNKSSQNAYEAGKIFYNRKIEELTLAMNEALNTYSILENLDQLEEAELKLKQLLRREEMLKTYDK